MSADQLTRLVELLRQGAEAHGFLGDVWTRRRVAQLIQDEFAISYHPTHDRPRDAAGRGRHCRLVQPTLARA